MEKENNRYLEVEQSETSDYTYVDTIKIYGYEGLISAYYHNSNIDFILTVLLNKYPKYDFVINIDILKRVVRIISIKEDFNVKLIGERYGGFGNSKEWTFTLLTNEIKSTIKNLLTVGEEDELITLSTKELKRQIY